MRITRYKISEDPMNTIGMERLIRDVESSIDKLYYQQEKAGLDEDEYNGIMSRLDYLRTELRWKDRWNLLFDELKNSNYSWYEERLRVHKAIIVGLAVCVAVLCAGVLFCGG